MQEIQACFSKYFTLAGKSGQREYVFFLIFTLIIGAIGSVAGQISSILGLVVGIIGLLCIIPGITVTVRRLHDRGLSGLWALLLLIPVVNLVLVIYLCLAPSK